MMKPNELRVGNYVILENDLRVENGYIHEVTEIRQLDCQIKLIEVNDYERYGQFYKYIKPIPLTEKMIQDLGFKIDVEDHCILEILKRSRIHLYGNDKEGFRCELGNKSGYSFGYPDIKYIHQLQNLYFAINFQLNFEKNDDDSL